MGFSYQDFEAKAAEAHKGLTIDDGGDPAVVLLTFRPALRLSDAETVKLTAAQDALKAYQTTEKDESGKDVPKDVKPSELRRLLQNVLLVLADNHQAAKEFLRPADLAVHMTILEEYRKVTQAAEGNS